MTNPEPLLERFDLEVPDEVRAIAAEIHLVTNPDGTEMLWHYESGRPVFVHPARRCANCAEVITPGQCGVRCFGCADGWHL